MSHAFQTDGASATLLMSEEKALQLGFKPKAYLRYVVSVQLAAVPSHGVYLNAGTMYLWHRIQKINFCLGKY